MTNKITVMLVDDSSVIRNVIAKILKSDTDIDIVASVSDGAQAITMAKIKKPDITILDVEMPVMDGLTSLPKILESSPKTKVIMCSSLTAKGADITIKAMSLGAVECVVKPTSSLDSGEGSDFQKNLIRLVKTLGESGKNYSKPTSTATSQDNKVSHGSPLPINIHASGDEFILKPPNKHQLKPEILVIGSSTGGPKALFKVLENIGNLDVPIVITQHMPATFTAILAKHIQQNTGLEAFEGDDGMLIEAGKIYVAPGGKHMLFKGDKPNNVKIKLDYGQPENFCKPSVEPMLRSVMDIYKNRILCVILTGMGQDGINSASTLSENGGQVFAQDKETSVVWGMPGAVAVAGICEKVLPIDNIAAAIKNALR